MWRVVKLYRSATGGQMSVLMALAIVPLLLAAGAALDYNSAVRLRVELHASLDAAAMAMATASEQPDEDRKAIGEKYFKQNLAGTALAEIEPQILIDEDTITVSARYDYPTSFMHLGGIDQMILDETSKVMRPFAGSAEVVVDPRTGLWALPLVPCDVPVGIEYLDEAGAVVASGPLGIWD